jgi:predicted HTH domain antitoxin
VALQLDGHLGDGLEDAVAVAALGLRFESSRGKVCLPGEGTKRAGNSGRCGMGKPLRVSEDVVAATRMTEEELAREFAVFLYLEGKLSLARAKEIAGMDRVSFQQLLASRKIPIRYVKADLGADVATLRKLKRL